MICDLILQRLALTHTSCLYTIAYFKYLPHYFRKKSYLVYHDHADMKFWF